ncbi:MAG: hypothetical protein Q4G35_07090 [Propionibacteriaceae bacterium]|nr:hypothetical protein [Propionibacteriaceae bacterium]
MKMRNTVIAALAVAALGLSACGGDATPAPGNTSPATTPAAAPAESTQPAAPAETTEPAPAEETTEAAPAEAPAPADFPFEEGPVDLSQFIERYTAAQTSIKTSKSVQTSTASLSTPMVTYTDASDPNNIRSYSVIEGEGPKIETVGVGDEAYMRTDGGAWEKQDLPDIPGMGMSQAEGIAKAIAEVELVNKADRQFKVMLDLGAALGGEAGEAKIPTMMWLDEQFRLIKQEVEMMGVTSTTEYSNFDEPVDIPAVP